MANNIYFIRILSISLELKKFFFLCVCVCVCMHVLKLTYFTKHYKYTLFFLTLLYFIFLKLYIL